MTEQLNKYSSINNKNKTEFGRIKYATEKLLVRLGHGCLGLQPEDFEFFTTFENSHYCKPNLDYYREILEKLSLKPEECLMVGNDVSEDMITEQLGMKTFLLTDCLINKAGVDISQYHHGGFAELDAYLKELLA